MQTYVAKTAMRKKAKSASLRSGELVFAVLITGFSLAALWQSYKISGFTGLSTPGIFPMLAAGTMLISALFIVVDAVSRRNIESEPDAVAVRVLTGRLSITVVLIATYVFAMPYLGFTLSSALFLFVAFAYLWRKNMAISLLLTAGTLSAIYLVFRVLFQVVLPRGSLLQGWL
jgi:hypothetical protein